jgi:hypothetical protein
LGIIILPTDFHPIIFQRARFKPPTRFIVDLPIEDGDFPSLLENYPQECGEPTTVYHQPVGNIHINSSSE